MQIPFDLSDAVADLGLGRYQQIILNTILKEVLGPSKASVVTINQAELSRRHNVHRQHLNRGLQDLLKLRVIVQHGNNYGFNYVTSEWTRNGESLPSFASMTVTTDDAASVDVTKSGYKQAQVVTKSGYTHVTENGYKSTDQIPPCNQERLHMSPNLVTNVTESGYTSSIEKNLERKTESPQPQTQVQEPIQPEASLTPERSPFWEPKNIDELWAWVEEQEFDTSGMEGSQLTGICKTYTTRWVYYSLRIAVQRDIDQPKGFITKILREWHAKGQKAIQGGGLASVTPWIDYERIKLDEPEEDEKPDPNDFRHWPIERRIERNKQILAFQAEKERKLAERALRLQQQNQPQATQGVAAV